MFTQPSLSFDLLFWIPLIELLNTSRAGWANFLITKIILWHTLLYTIQRTMYILGLWQLDLSRLFVYGTRHWPKLPSDVWRWGGGGWVQPSLHGCWSLPVHQVQVWKVWKVMLFFLKTLQKGSISGAVILVWQGALAALEASRWTPTKWLPPYLDWSLVPITGQIKNY